MLKRILGVLVILVLLLAGATVICAAQNTETKLLVEIPWEIEPAKNRFRDEILREMVESKMVIYTIPIQPNSSLKEDAEIESGEVIDITEAMETTEPTDPTEPTETMLTTDPENQNEAQEKEPENFYFGTEITFTSEYISNGVVMPYALYTPSTVDENEKTPLIVWLHGSGEKSVSVETFFNRGLPSTINSWTLEGFNAYIVCPHLTGKWNPGAWNTVSSKNNLQAMLDVFIIEHNVDTENIIVIGHSLGGQGALYMAHELPDYFSRCIVLSGYNPGIDINEVAIPTIGYVGTSSAGEDSGSIYYMENFFAKTFGAQSNFSIQSSHGNVPRIALNIDENQNNRSDLVEWMFGELELIQS